MGWYPNRKGQVSASKEAKAERKAARRAQREAEKTEREARGEHGAPIDWSLTPTADRDAPQ